MAGLPKSNTKNLRVDIDSQMTQVCYNSRQARYKTDFMILQGHKTTLSNEQMKYIPKAMEIWTLIVICKKFQKQPILKSTRSFYQIWSKILDASSTSVLPYPMWIHGKAINI